ncbi:MAG: dTDP-4-dehydrorhamnose reductase [bacterium]|nr:dTDP-4-dehydrorhamnose reductase [bacterium]
MKFSITGSKGMLGSDITSVLKEAGHEVFDFGKNQLDITDARAVNSTLSSPGDIDYLINCAAYTDVDGCETNKDLAVQVNSHAPQNLAFYCRKKNIPLIHFSTDYVFNGSKDSSYKESDECNPVNFYGHSKLKGEQAIQSICTKYYIFRLQWLYGENGSNFVSTIMNLARNNSELSIVTDQYGSPTWTKEVGHCLSLFLTEEPDFGIYHLTNEGLTNWHSFAEYFLEYAQLPCKLNKTTTEKSTRPAKRPKNTNLSINKFLDLRIVKPNHWQLAIKKYLNQKGYI